MRFRYIPLVGLLAVPVACGGESDDLGSAQLVTSAGETTSDSKPTSSPSATVMVTEPTEEDSSNESGEGVYVWESDTGAGVRYTVPAPADNETVAAIELYRTDVGRAEEASYVLAEIDNTAGSENTQIPDLSIVTQDGETIAYGKAWLLVGAWQNESSIDDTDLYNRGVEIYNALLDDDFALPGAKTTTILAASSIPASVGRVFATSGFGEPVELSKG